MKFGRFELFPLSDGFFRLDGGAMFGTVPKTLWCRHEPADEHNRIPLCLGSLLIKTPKGRHVLVDTGLSSKYERNAKFNDIYRVERRVTLRDELKGLGLLPGDVDLVINTHLHFDHAGGDTEYSDEGKAVPAFEKARYLMQKEEWEDANHPHERNKASYMEENFAPLQDYRRLELVSGDYEIEPGLKVLRSGGHTRGHQCVMVESEGETAVFLGDLIPTSSHLPLPYVMGYDLYPLDTLEAKRSLLAEAREKNWTLIFQHDVRRRHAKIDLVDGKYVAKVEAPA
ncbi:MAG: MBL fold metallo-hydrolase [Elusimicrobia bacterium]|nr:MBL fold metallo-hydrolase [Elusimicrobiota bacterium]